MDDLGDLVVISRAASEAAAGCFKGGLQVDARLCGEGIAFCHDDHVSASDDVVDQLGDAAAACAAGVDGIAQAFQQGLDLFKGFLVAAGHNGQGASDGHGVAATDGGVQQEHTGLLCILIHFLDDVGCSGAQVYDDAAGLAKLDGLFHGVTDDCVGGEDLHDDVTGLVDLICVLHSGAACGSEFFQALFRHVKAHDLMTRLLDQILCHRQTHDAHTQKTDFHSIISFILILCCISSFF